MDEGDLYDVITEYGDRYAAIYSNYVYTEKIFYDEETIGKLATTASDAYDKVVDDYTQFIDSYVGGTYNVALLRNTRKSAKAFAVAVEALEKALMAQA